MSRICCVCGKGPQVGNIVSHANNKTKRWVYPNVHRMRFTLSEHDSRVKSGNVCSKCMKAKKVIKFV